MSKQIKILITGAGGAGTIAIIKSLKWIGGYEIIACDANPNAYGLRIAHHFHVVPMGNDKDFSYKMRAILEFEKPQYIIPLVDEEIMKFHQLFWDLKDNWKLVCPSALFCAIALDKYGTHLELKKHGLLTPTTMVHRPMKEVVKINHPVIVKQRKGHGSKGLHYFDNYDLCEDTHPWVTGGNRIIQERIFGTEFTVSVIVGLDGQLLSIVPKEVIDKRGITMTGITRNVPEIEEVCKKIVEKMNPMGPFNVQLMMDKNGLPWIFEINPRYSTTVALTIAAGINEVDAVIKRAEGRQTKKSFEFIPNMVMNRYYTQDFVRQ
jgi:carbamoyl-phosphate synthase large subunit